MPEQRFTPRAPSGLKRLYRALTKRPTRRHLAVGVLVGLLAYAAVVQVRGDQDDVLEGARRDELLQILDGLSRQGDRLEDEAAELEANKEELLSGADSESAARAQAEERLKRLKVLTGEAQASGPGISVTIDDPSGGVDASILLAAVEELRAAEAEAIQIEDGGGSAVRVVVDTYFTDPGGGGVNVSGKVLQPPYTILAIGESNALSGAMEFPDSVVDKVAAVPGGEAIVTQLDDVTVDALHEPDEPEYAQPVPDDGDDDE